jgi:large subunit ribosomal protein L15
MDLSNLKPAAGSIKTRKRIGRGQGSGRGGTSTKGHKGAQSRTGYSRKIGFEGGQMPLQRRIPKGGFKNINREVLIGKNLIGKNELYKILGRGEMKSGLEVHADKFSESAKAAIEKAGGSAHVNEK